MNHYTKRLALLQSELAARNLTGAVLAGGDNMRYIGGFAEGGHERLVALFVPAEGEPVFVVPKMNAPQAARNLAGFTQVVGWTDEAGWLPDVSRILEAWPDGVVAIDDELHSVHLLALQSLSARHRYTPAGPLMSSLREIKTADELDAMQRSGALTDAVCAEAVKHLRLGITEVEFADIIARLYRANGTKPEFALICFGENAALPHHHTGSRKLQAGDVVIIDIGCRVDDYASDITRTFAFGEPDPEAKTVYETVYRAHMAAMQHARPGVSCESVDAAARSVIQEAGYGEFFVHRTGHGIGLSTHEPPYIVAGSTQALQQGMCFSDEPGIYLPGRFGVRIENILTVTETGVRSLNAPPPPSLTVLTVEPR
jgi:Xaa-Pro aminopeptidase